MKNKPHIIAYTHTLDIVDKKGVIMLIQNQMECIGYHQTREDVEKELTNSMKSESRAILFVYYSEDSKAIGCAYGNVCSGFETKGDYFWLNELYVLEEYREHGIGSAVIDFMKHYCKNLGYLYIAMVTHPTNFKAQEFYKGKGFDLEELTWVDTYL